MNVFLDFLPNFTTTKPFKNPKPTLFYWVLFEIVLACFFSLGNNLWHKHLWRRCRGRSWRHIFPGILISFTGLRGVLEPTLLKANFSPKLSQRLLEEWEPGADLLHRYIQGFQTLNRYWKQQENFEGLNLYQPSVTLNSWVLQYIQLKLHLGSSLLYLIALFKSLQILNPLEKPKLPLLVKYLFFNWN